MYDMLVTCRTLEIHFENINVMLPSEFLKGVKENENKTLSKFTLPCLPSRYIKFIFRRTNICGVF